MWSFRPLREAKAIAGFSAVRKKDPEKQRKLLMAVPTNFLWCDPANSTALGLHGGGAVSKLWVDGPALDLATFDADNAFTRIATPAWMWAYMAVFPQAAQVGTVGHASHESFADTITTDELW